MADLHIEDFHQDVARILLALYASFPRPATLFVSDLIGEHEPDAFGVPAVRHQACFSAMLWLADAAPVEFAEAGATKKVTPVEWLKNFIVTGTPVVQFGEFAAAGGPDADAGSAKGKTDHEIDAAAKAYAAKNNVQYMDALRAVVGFTA